ncbi:MAG: YciI family protein [Planctomycetota bacterium]
MDTATATSSSYMLLFRDSSPETYAAMSPAQLEQCLDKWNGWFEGLLSAGKVAHGHPLHPAGRVVTARDGKVLDGPFSEAKEAIGGYFLLLVDTLEEATAIAKRCPNLEHGMIVEVRPVAAVCHLASSLGRETMKG